MKKIIEFLFFRWKKEIIARGRDRFFNQQFGSKIPNSEHSRDFIEYKYTNKFDGSEKIKRKYLN